MALRLAILGFGQRGAKHAEILGKRTDCKIVAVVDPSAERRKYAAATTCAQVYPTRSDIGDVQIEGVLICSPPAVRLEAIQWALARDIRVFCEEPLALSFEEGEAIVKACCKHGTHLMTGYTTCYKWPFNRMRKIFNENRIGDLVSVWLTKTEYFDDKRWAEINADKHWRALDRTGGGRHIERSHQLDWMISVGGKPQTIAGALDSVAKNARVDDVYTAFFRFHKGVGLIHVALTPATGEYISAGIVGSKGSVWFDGSRLLLRIDQHTEVISNEHAEDYYDALVDFLRDGVLPISNEESALETLSVALELKGLSADCN